MFSLQLKLFTLLSVVFHGALLGLLFYFAPKKVDIPAQPLKVGVVSREIDPGTKKGNPGPLKEKEPEPVKKAEPPKPKPEPVKKPEKKVAKKKPVKKAPEKEVITRAPAEEPAEATSNVVNPSQAGQSEEVALSPSSRDTDAGGGGSGAGSSGTGKGGDSVGYPDYGINPKPKYPTIAKRYGYEGLVILNVHVLENGRVGKIELRKSSGYDILDKSALDAVKGWIFVPGQRNGKPTSSWVVVPVRFNLTSG